MCHRNKLEVVMKGKRKRVSAVIWREQAKSTRAQERFILEIIHRSGVPCINPAKCLLAYEDRLASKTALMVAGLPMLPEEVLFGQMAILNYQPKFPCVLKAGNNHCGFGKARATNDEEWVDMADMAAAVNEYICIEPFIKYQRDLRYQIIGDDIYALERVPSCWKANASPERIETIDIDPKLEELSRKAAEVLGANVVGVDFIQDEDGEWLMLEANLIPGLGGYGQNLHSKMLNLIDPIDS
jgi:ribosomal protein S6--L-glutamate ligase